jgi:hypothetical protein
MSLPAGAWIGIGMLAGGQLSWKLSAYKAKAWLTANDPSFQAPGVAANLLIGGLFTSFGPMARYGQLAREQGASPAPVYGFWGGFVISLLGVVVTLATLLD